MVSTGQGPGGRPSTDLAWIYNCVSREVQHQWGPQTQRGAAGGPAATRGCRVQVNGTEVKAGKQVSHATGSGVQSSTADP